MSDFVLADDLSGALDAAAAFHATGRRVVVALSPDDWPDASCDDVVVVTTETRNAAARVAAERVVAAIQRGRASGGRLLYKKIDSTLRGPVAAEIVALRQMEPHARILFLPANPAVGRTVRGGVLCVRGVPVAETDFGRDPLSPVRESVIRRLLGAAAEPGVVIADAESEDDLSRAVARMDEAGLDWIPVGSGALARPAAARLTRLAARGPRPVPGGSPGPALLLCGSAHPLNRVQAANLAAERDVAWHELRFDNPAAEAVDALVNDLRGGRGAALLVDARRGDSTAVIRLLTDVAARVITATEMRRIFITGGETAYALCRALGISALEFERELESGLSLSRSFGGSAECVLAIKPGGFGDPRTWVRAWDALTGRTSIS